MQVSAALASDWGSLAQTISIAAQTLAALLMLGELSVALQHAQKQLSVCGPCLALRGQDHSCAGTRTLCDQQQHRQLAMFPWQAATRWLSLALRVIPLTSAVSSAGHALCLPI